MLKHTKEVLIGSVFVDDSPAQLSWLKLQKQFVQNNNKNYDYVACCHKELDGETKVVSKSKSKNRTGSFDHIDGLNKLLDYFKEHRNSYKYFLFLDNDAWPIRPDWLQVVSGQMNKRGSELAAAMRHENLEIRLHASVLLCKPDALDRLKFQLVKTKNHLSDESDVIIGPYYQNRHYDKTFPLLRSNKLNLHPLFFGVYYDCFYHHGGGSRPGGTYRGRLYWTDAIGNFHEKIGLRRLQVNKFDTDPVKFISELAGWNPKLYT